jgi:assimilatory nitrate reductase catalytic subunit
LPEESIPGPGVDAVEMFRKIDAGEIKGLLSICFNPKVSLARVTPPSRTRA